MNRKSVYLILVVVVVLLSGSLAIAAGLYEVTEPTKIVFWHHHEDQWVPFLNEIVAKFHEEYPLITVEPVFIGNYREVSEHLTAAVASGDVPALSTADIIYITSYAASGMLEPLDLYIKDYGLDMSDFGEGLVGATRYKDQQIAFPYLVSTQVMYYNKTVADAEGIIMPKTFADLEDFLKKATVFNSDGTTARYGTVFGGWSHWYYMYLFENNGVKLVLEDGLTSDVNNEMSVYITTKMKEWIDQGYAYFAYGTGASSNMRQSFWDGKAFSVFHTSSLYDVYVENSPFQLGMIWSPGAIDGSAFRGEIGGPTLIIPSNASQKQKNAAWTFMAFVGRPENNLFWADKTGYFPNRQSVVSSPEYKEYLARKPAMAEIIGMSDWLRAPNPHPAFEACGAEWQNALFTIFNEGAPVQATLDKLKVTIEDILADY